MIRKAEYTEWIDNYMSKELSTAEMDEFEKELKINSELKDEFELHNEIEKALTEQDVLKLKENLNVISKSETSGSDYFSATFDLLEDLENFNDFEEKVDSEELLNYYESLPKLHIYQHEVASRENVHHFYKEQELVKAELENEDFFTDEDLMSEIEDAITEKDVIQLRDNLKQVAQSLPEHSYSTEEIDQYVEGTLPEADLVEFEKELAGNKKLQADVRLHNDLNEALIEKDVIDLKGQLSSIMATQTSYNQEFDDIEQYIDGELSDDSLKAFEEEMFENLDLRSDVNLHKEINSAASETDIINLRDKLAGISQEIEIKDEKSIFNFNTRRIGSLTRYSAAVSILIIFGLSIVFKLAPVKNDTLYDNYYETYPSLGISRSATADSDLKFKQGLVLYGEQNFEKALNIFKEVIEEDETNSVVRFYAGESYQNLDQFSNAIKEYQFVINENDNLFVEHAQWYMGLCFIKKGEIELANKQLNRIIAEDGYYKPKAEALIRQLKFTETVE